MGAVGSRGEAPAALHEGQGPRPARALPGVDSGGDAASTRAALRVPRPARECAAQSHVRHADVVPLGAVLDVRGIHGGPDGQPVRLVDRRTRCRRSARWRSSSPGAPNGLGQSRLALPVSGSRIPGFEAPHAAQEVRRGRDVSRGPRLRCVERRQRPLGASPVRHRSGGNRGRMRHLPIPAGRP